MKTQTCCFTGHRRIPSKEIPSLRAHLEWVIIDLIGQGIRYFGTGGALGFDTLAAQTVLKLKLTFPHIRLVLVLPCKDQAKMWRAADQKIYDQIRDEADKVVYVSEHYYRGCMRDRNRYLVDHSGVCVCYQTKITGGAAYTVEYARKKALTVINLVQPRFYV